jgi:probable HAF family extracellular repeat protein
MTTYTYTTLDFPLSGPHDTKASGISNLGDKIVGNYVYPNPNSTQGGFLTSGFLYSSGTFTTIDPAGPSRVPGEGANGINDAGQIVGTYIDANQLEHAYLYSGGTYTTVDDPNGPQSEARGINKLGEIVGTWFGVSDAGPGGHGFVYSGGTYTTLDDPNATNIFGAGFFTFATGINDSGQIVGSYDSRGRGFPNHGFLYSGGTYTTIDDPAAPGLTNAWGINDAGQIVGDYQDNTGVVHGFLYSGGTFTNIDDPLAVASDFSGQTTVAQGIDAAGDIVGYYIDSSGATHGFLATPDTDTTAEPPGVTAPSSLPVPAGGSTSMGIVLKPVDSDDTISVSISGVPDFEQVTAAGATPTVTHQNGKGGGSSTYTFNALPSADWNNGLILHSSFSGKGRPVNSLTVTASNSTTGETATSAPKTIAVTDPPATSRQQNLTVPDHWVEALAPPNSAPLTSLTASTSQQMTTLVHSS